MATTPHVVIDYLNTLLSGSATLNYVKQFMIGAREKIASYPAIIINPISNVEIAEFIGSTTTLKLTVEIIGLVSVYDKDKQIVGDANTKGIFDMENDVKNVLDTKMQMPDDNSANQVVDTKIIETLYDFMEYPIRGFNIKLEVNFRQIREGR